MVASDFIALAIAFFYVALLIFTAELLRRYFHVPVDITRKIVHIGVGMTALVVTAFFRDWYIAILGPLAFILVNYISYRERIFRSIETGEDGQLGTIYFPLSFVILIPLLWMHPAQLAAAFMPMTWGDASAAILGKRFGSLRFTLFGQESSVQGSLAMFVFSFVATFGALTLFGRVDDARIVAAVVLAFFASFVEALSPRGLDNLTVPLASAIIASVLIK